MFNSIGFGELAIICIVLIIAVGPERLPSMMKTVGKTVRTLRQASRDLRESTGIDELLREDFDYTPPPRRAPEAQTVSRDIELVTDGSKAGLPSDGPVTSEVASEATAVAADGVVAEPHAPAPLGTTPEAGAASPHTNPQANPHTELPEFVPANHADIAGTLPSDAPLAAHEPTHGPQHDSEADRAVKPRES